MEALPNPSKLLPLGFSSVTSGVSTSLGARQLPHCANVEPRWRDATSARCHRHSAWSPLPLLPSPSPRPSPWMTRTCHGASSAGWRSFHGRICPLFGEVRNRDFAAGGRRALLELPAAQANASARPRGSPYAVSIRINRQASPSGEEMTETAVSEFFGVAAAPGGLRSPPPSPRSWKHTKK